MCVCVCVCVCAQSCPALCDPMDCSPPGSSVHGILQGCVCVFALSHVRLFVTLWTAVHQAPLSMGFSRQQHWSQLPCPPPGHLPDPGMESVSPALAGRFFTTVLPARLLNFQLFKDSKKL